MRKVPARRGIEPPGSRMNIGRLLEVGVAVPDLDAATRTFVRLLGTGATDPIRAPMFAMDFRMCRLGDVDFELMMPYAARWIAGSDQRRIIPLTMLCSVNLLLAADIAGRLIIYPDELDAGIVVAFLGAPVLIMLARSARTKTL